MFPKHLLSLLQEDFGLVPGSNPMFLLNLFSSQKHCAFRNKCPNEGSEQQYARRGPEQDLQVMLTAGISFKLIRDTRLHNSVGRHRCRAHVVTRVFSRAIAAARPKTAPIIISNKALTASGMSGRSQKNSTEDEVDYERPFASISVRNDIKYGL